MATQSLWVDLSGSAAGVATADFSHTTEFTGITVLDGSSHPVSNYTVISGSGTTYPFDADQVPEPGTLMLLGLGFAGLSAFRLRSAALRCIMEHGLPRESGRQPHQ
jgi:hypothetical protein